MTRDEILLAAQVAERYPPGFGYRWGYGPLNRVGTRDELLQAGLAYA